MSQQVETSESQPLMSKPDLVLEDFPSSPHKDERDSSAKPQGNSSEAAARKTVAFQDDLGGEIHKVHYSEKLHYSTHNTFLYGDNPETTDNGSVCCVVQ